MKQCRNASAVAFTRTPVTGAELDVEPQFPRNFTFHPHILRQDRLLDTTMELRSLMRLSRAIGIIKSCLASPWP
jgi:hypothetical protein